VNGSTVTFGDVTIGTRDGKNVRVEFSYGPAKQTAILQKSADTTAQNKLVGSRIGTTATQSVTLVVSINGRDARMQYTKVRVLARGTSSCPAAILARLKRRLDL
jgi:hypothetical protein